jgi:hypothetical protein
VGFYYATNVWKFIEMYPYQKYHNIFIISTTTKNLHIFVSWYVFVSIPCPYPFSILCDNGMFSFTPTSPLGTLCDSLAYSPPHGVLRFVNNPLKDASYNNIFYIHLYFIFHIHLYFKCQKKIRIHNFAPSWKYLCIHLFDFNTFKHIYVRKRFEPEGVLEACLWYYLVSGKQNKD